MTSTSMASSPTVLCIMTIALFILPGSSSAAYNPVNSLVFSFFNYVQGSNCKFECPNGAAPKPNEGMYIAPSGCGSYDMSVGAANSIAEVHHCCNQHDTCYSRCLAVKGDCDRQLHECLTSFCHHEEDVAKYPYLTRSVCLGLADWGFTTVQRFGCEAFKNDQQMVCMCPETEMSLLQVMVARMRGKSNQPPQK